EVRVGGFNGVSGAPLAGRWNPVEVKLDGASSAAPAPVAEAAPVAEPAPEPVAEPAAEEPMVEAAPEPAEEAAPEPAAEAAPAEDPLAGLDDLDALLASLNTDAAPAAEPAADA